MSPVDVEALKEALTAVVDEIEAMKKQQDEIVDRLAELQDEKRGLELAVARHGGVQVARSSGWLRLTRTDAVIRVLRLDGNSLSPKEITDRLRSTGRDDRYPLISAALAYLKRQGVVVSAGYGLWRLSSDFASDDMQPTLGDGEE